MNLSNLTAAGNDISTANLNRSDTNWFNSSNVQSSNWKLNNDLSNYKDEEESGETVVQNTAKSSLQPNKEIKTGKVCFNKVKFIIDNTKNYDDAVKLEKLIYGYENKQKISKQPTSSEFGDSAADGDKTKNCNEESKEAKANLEQLHIVVECDKNEVEYNESSVRILHKIVSNTLSYYHFNDNYNTDKVMKLFAEHDLIKYSEIATNHADPRELNSRIDLGEYPISKIYNKKKKKEKENDIESQAQQPNKEIKKQKYSDLMFLPPKPNKYIDVITYSECSPIYTVREDQINEETLKLTNADRQEFLLTISTINKILKPLRGKVALLDRIILLYLIFGFFIIGGIAVVLGMFVHYAISIVIAVLYFALLGALVYISKKRSSTLIKNAHLCLSFYLHAENSRYYKSK